MAPGERVCQPSEEHNSGLTPRSPKNSSSLFATTSPLTSRGVCEHTHLSPDDAIRLHSATEVHCLRGRVRAGISVSGYLPTELCAVGRLPSPSLRVEPGSGGITGRQTAIYPQASPGGWNLIGRAPLVIVDVASGFFPLRVGDRVRFERIDEGEFRKLKGRRLEGERSASAGRS